MDQLLRKNMKRLIPVLLYKDGYLVKSRNFKEFQTIGNPFEEVKRFNSGM